MRINNAPFVARRVGTTGHEILDSTGSVVAWTVDGYWAAVLAELLNRAEADGLSGRPTVPPINPLIIRY